MMLIDEIPIRWGILLPIVVLISVGVLMVHIKTAQDLDRRRRNPTKSASFSVRNGSMWAQMLALCWTVVYGHSQGWEPWPPVVVFLAAYDVHLISQIAIMRADIARLPPHVAPNGYGSSGGASLP
jgi:cell division protein FtsW (lipid II flippase)